MKETNYYAFSTIEEAQSVIDALKAEGCSYDDMVLYANQTDEVSVKGAAVQSPKTVIADIATGMMVVGALGGLFELFMETKVFHAMEFGPATIYPLLGILIGIAAGMFLGALIGLYIYMGRPECGCRKQLADNQLVLAVEKEKVAHLKEKQVVSYQI